MDALANLIIRPERANYNPNRDLGPKQFFLAGKSKQRIDFELTNIFSLKLKCSLFAPSAPKSKYPCVIYCHGNSGSRTEALEAVDLFLPYDILVATLDFSGSGLSEGKYVTLGYNEHEDLKCLVNHLRTLNYVSDIGLWGRSMGAATCIMYASKDPCIAALCLDSAFTNLTQLCTDTLRSRTLGTLLGGMFFTSVRKIIHKKANFDLEEVAPLNCIPHCQMPAFLLHGIRDKIVPITHLRALATKYPGNNKVHELNLEHNDPRPKWIKQEIRSFFIQKFSEAKKKQEFNQQVVSALTRKLSDPKIDPHKIEEVLNRLAYGENLVLPSNNISHTEASSLQEIKESERLKGISKYKVNQRRMSHMPIPSLSCRKSEGPSSAGLEKSKAQVEGRNQQEKKEGSYIKLSQLLGSGQNIKVDLQPHQRFLKKNIKLEKEKREDSIYQSREISIEYSLDGEM